jgi:hypothetical protein
VRIAIAPNAAATPIPAFAPDERPLGALVGETVLFVGDVLVVGEEGAVVAEALVELGRSIERWFICIIGAKSIACEAVIVDEEEDSSITMTGMGKERAVDMASPLDWHVTMLISPLVCRDMQVCTPVLRQEYPLYTYSLLA